MGGALLSLLLPPLGACLQRFCLPGVTRPSAALPRAGSLQPLRGFALNAGHPRTVPDRELAIPFGTRADGQGVPRWEALGRAVWLRPEGATGLAEGGPAPSPGQRPGLRVVFQARPEGAKAMGGALLSTRGDASFDRSTPGWELATPSGFFLERWFASWARRGAGRAVCQLFPFLPTIWVTCSTEMTEYLFQPTCGSTFS